MTTSGTVRDPSNEGGEGGSISLHHSQRVTVVRNLQNGTEEQETLTVRDKFIRELMGR